MSKRTRTSARRRERKTNWLLIGGIVAVAAVALFVLLALTLQGPGSSNDPAVSALANYCLDNPDNCLSQGSPDAPVTIVEISDYGCGHCRDFNLETLPILEEQYVTSNDVYWVVLPYALREETIPSAASALCAAEQDRFFEYHRKMFEFQTLPIALTPAGFLQAAGDLGLDLEQFNSCLESGKYNSTIRANASAASAAGIRATPTFFINTQKLEGNYPIADFQQQIESYLSGS